jgi:hypothetical protein
MLRAAFSHTAGPETASPSSHYFCGLIYTRVRACAPFNARTREKEILITQVLRRSASPFFIKVCAGTKQTNKHSKQIASH